MKKEGRVSQPGTTSFSAYYLLPQIASSGCARKMSDVSIIISDPAKGHQQR